MHWTWQLTTNHRCLPEEEEEEDFHYAQISTAQFSTESALSDATMMLHAMIFTAAVQQQ